MGIGGFALERIWRLPAATHRIGRVVRDIPVPGADGVALLTDVLEPLASGPVPTLLQRTPYGRRTLADLSGLVYVRRGVRVVVQSCRGTFGSGGVFAPQRHEREDGLATLRWIEQQPWFDGRLALAGPSYLGYAQWAIAADAGPALRAICPHTTIASLPAHWYHGGSFALGDALSWTAMVSTQERGLPAAFRSRRRLRRALAALPLATLDERVLGHAVPFWRDFVTYASEHDPFWRPVDHSARVGAVRVPVTMVTGWYDVFLPLQLADHARLVAAGNVPRLVIGPWSHASAACLGAQSRETLAALRAHLVGDARARPASPVSLYLQGAKAWRELEAWPPPGTELRAWHLHPDGLLAADVAGPGARSYRYDPAHPTPVAGGTMLTAGAGRKRQRRIEARRDVLVYTSARLARDLDVIGPVEAEIAISSSEPHFDVCVRLCVVDARGRSSNVCDGLERVAPGRFEAGPGGVHRVRVALWPTGQRFRAGERIRVQVSSGAHPRYARNLGTGEPLATGTAMRASEQTVHHGPGAASWIRLPVAPDLSLQA
jgi:putative CocE/NonD family hydrolase